MSSTIGKLPITVYETVFEGDNPDDGDKSMQIDDQQRNLTLRFRPVSYSIETGEAEMISVDSVATGGGNATAIPVTEPSTSKPDTKRKEKEKRQKISDGTEKDDAPEVSPLSKEDEDCMYNLSRMMKHYPLIKTQ